MLRSDARRAYDALAPDYDAFTADYDHGRWLEQIDGVVRSLGLHGRRVLDVACGTGKSLVPLLERGYDVTGCDVSPEMLELAAERTRAAARLVEADMRDLPALGSFDLVTCLDDAVNYLTEPGDLGAFLAGARRALRPGGLLVFDVNTLAMYRDAFAATSVLERDDRLFVWVGEATGPEDEPESEHVATLDVFHRSAGDTWTRRRSIHRQRHHPAADVLAALSTSGLACRATYGQLPGAELTVPADEHDHPKLLFIAENPDRGGSP